MVVAQISVGEHIIADRLARPKAAAMADHQPHFGPKHRDMVAHRLRIGRPDPDIDQGDPAAALGHQMISGHLVPAPVAGGDLGLGIGQIPALEDGARHRQRAVRAVLARSASTAKRTNSST